MNLFRHALLACLLSTLALAQDPSPLGEFQVSVGAATAVQQCSADTDGQGNAVIVWSAIRPDGSGYDIYCRRYNTACSPLAAPGSSLGEFRVNTVVSGQQEAPCVAVNKTDGSFVVTWEANQPASGSLPASTGYDIYFRSFAADGTPLDPEERVANIDERLNNEFVPAVAIDPRPQGAGQFVIVWTNVGNRLRAQRFSASGSPIGGAIEVSTGEPDANYASVACDGVGRFVVAYHAQASGSDAHYNVRVRRFDFDTGAAETPTAITANLTDGLDHQFPQIETGADNSFAVTWSSAPFGGSIYDIRARLFSAASPAAPLSGVAVLNQGTVGSQLYGSIRYLPAGGFVATWGSEGDIIARVFNADLTPSTGDLTVKTSSAGVQEPSVAHNLAVDPQGNFLIAYADVPTLTFRAEKFYLPNQGPPLSEFRVSTTTAGDQDLAMVAMNESGNAVVVWQGKTAGNRDGLFFQRYNASGLRVGPETPVNANTVGDQFSPAVAMAANGDFVVVWVTAAAGDEDVYGQRFNALGQAQGNEFPVNTTTGGYQGLVAVAMDSAGNFVVTWRSVDQDGDSEGGIIFQRFTAAGSTIGGEEHVNETTQYDQTLPSIAMNSSGEFNIVWRGIGDVGLSTAVYGRRYRANGTAKGGEFLVNAPTADSEGYQSIALLDSRRFIVAYHREYAPGNMGYDVFARVFTTDVNDVVTAGNEISVNLGTAGRQFYPSLSATQDGTFRIAWTSESSDGSGVGIVQRAFQPNGLPLGSETPMNIYTAGEQSSYSGRAIAMDGAGNYFVVWQSLNQDGSGYGVYATKVTVSESPSVMTLSAMEIGAAKATLRAVIDPNGQTATMAFDYDEDATFSSPSVVQVPGSFAGINPEEVSVEVTQGLSKDVKYYFRAKATVGTQVILGNVLTFTTANAVPVANDDTVFVPGGQVSFLPQGNDSDLDQAAATLVAEVLTQPVVEGGAQAGIVKAVPGSNRLSFQANSAFVEEATFTYRLKDTDNAVSNEATVTLVRFGALRGTYQGLVTGTGGAGSLVLTLNGTAGQVTGALIFQGVRYVIDGAFNEAGLLQDFIGTTGLGLFLAISTDGTITGAIKDLEGNVVADVTLDLIDGGSGDGFEPQTGQYTTFLDLPESAAVLAETNGGGSAVAVPQGTGFLALTIGSKKAKFPLRVAGELPDRTKLSAGGIGLAKRRYTIAQQLYRQGKDKFRGDIFGRPEFLGGVNNQLDTEFVWNKRPEGAAALAPNAGGDPELFENGFTNLRLLLKALPFTRDKQPIDFDDNDSPNAKLTVSKGGIDPAQFATLKIDANNRSTVIESNGLDPKVKIKARNPLFSGSFQHPALTNRVKFQGIFVQGVEKRGRGVFIATDDFGSGTQQGATGKVLLEKIVQ